MSSPPKHNPRRRPARPAMRAPAPAPAPAPGHVAAPPCPLSDAELAQLAALLEAVPPPHAAMDPAMLDGYLVGVLLQPQRIPVRRWLPPVVDGEGQGMRADAALVARIEPLVRRRHAELDAAIAQRAWFDPWVWASDAIDPAVYPWVAGFAVAMSAFPALMEHPSPELTAPLALLLRHLDPDDLEDADALLAEIDTLAPLADVDSAVEDLVRATLLLADVARPRAAPASG